jgi:hypothetical protein
MLDKKFTYPSSSCGLSLNAALEYLYWAFPLLFTKLVASLVQFIIAFASHGLVDSAIFHFGLAEARKATVVNEERDWCSSLMLTTNGDFKSVIFIGGKLSNILFWQFVVYNCITI